MPPRTPPAMVGSWATFASPLTEDDTLLLPSPEFDDDDPSSYLLYPPGFGPVVDWLVDGRNVPMLAGEAAVASDPHGPDRKDADVVISGGREEATVDGSGALELLGLSEALSGKVSLVGGCASDCGVKDGVVEYMVIGGLEEKGDGEPGVCNPGGSGHDVSRDSGAGVNGEGGGSGVSLEVVGSKRDGNGVREAPPVVTLGIKLKEDDGNEETNLGSGGSSESESDGSSSSSSSSEEEEDDDSDEDDDDEDDRDGRKGERMDEVLDFEEGEIRDLDAEKLAMSSDDDEDGGVKGPIKSKHELEVLPSVPPVNATLEPHHQTLPVGIVSSVICTKVIVEGLEKHNPLNEGSILWITETRSPLGLVDEIFGPVKNPYYVVRFNSTKEIPAGISEGTAVSFVMEFANHIVNEPALYMKGYDASGENDEEVGDEMEFSDDEKEAEYKRSLRQAKRGTDSRRQRSQESIGKKRVQFEKRRHQTKTTGFGKRKDVQPLALNALAPISQPPNITSQLQSTLRHPLAPNALAPVSQAPNIPSQLQSTPQQPFNPGGKVQAPPWRTCVPGQVQAPAQPPRVPCQVEAPSQSRAPGQVQAPPQPPFVLGQLQARPDQHCVPGQLQALQASLQKPCAAGQLQAPTPSPYVLSPLQTPTLPPCVPGLQAPSLASNVGGGDLPSFAAGHSCFSGSPTVPAIPYGEQLGGPFGLTQQNLLMPQSNALWATQQFITSLSGMFQNNGMPLQQQQDHPFHQNQTQLFPGFNSGMPFQHQLIPNQGIPPNMMPWQGGWPNPSIGPRSLEPMGQDSRGQALSGCISSGEQRAVGLSNCNQNRGQAETATAQGDLYAPMEFSLGNSSVRGRKPYGRGGRTTRS